MMDVIPPLLFVRMYQFLEVISAQQQRFVQIVRTITAFVLLVQTRFGIPLLQIQMEVM